MDFFPNLNQHIIRLRSGGAASGELISPKKTKTKEKLRKIRFHRQTERRSLGILQQSDSGAVNY